jgi:hypothetical protein
MAWLSSRGLQDLDERGLFALIDMYDSAIAETVDSDGLCSEEMRARLIRRREEVLNALADTTHGARGGVA